MARPVRDEDVAALAAAEPLVLLLDIDGTLAPIAPRPEDARVPDSTRHIVRRLVERPDTIVGLVSGRAAAGARELVGVDDVWVVGNHGAERIAPDGTTEVDHRVAAYEGALATAAASLGAAVAALPGVRLEDKGRSVAVHYRLAERRLVPQVEALVRDTARRAGLRVGAGKELFELRAPVDVDKGTAVLALLDRLGAHGDEARIAFIGDDITDEDAFRRLRLALTNALTIRVGPPDVATAAEIVVDDPEAVARLLERLADAR